MSIVDLNRSRIVCLSQDPKTIFSYGLQVKELISGLPKHQFHVISGQYLFGTPFGTALTDRNGKRIADYITWAHEGEERRCTSTLRNVIKETNPVCVFSMGDIHHHAQIPLGKNLQIPWVSWFPWDNHDVQAMIRNKHIIEQPDIKITMCNFSYDLMTQSGVEVDGMIYNIVDTSIFRPLKGNELNKERLIKLNPAIKGKKILLFVGRPNWRKNLEFLLGAFKEIARERDDVMLYLHVDFNDEGVLEKPNLHKMLHGSGLQRRVMYTEENRWTRGIGPEFLNRLYNLAYLYVSPHGGEGFGLPFCEAMACGVPFVATDCTSMPEFAGEDEQRGLLCDVAKNSQEKGVYRPWVDVKSFIDNIIFMLENEDIRNKMGKRGMYWVRNNCSKTKIIPQWQEVFDSLDVPLADVRAKATTLQWTDKYIPKQEAMQPK